MNGQGECYIPVPGNGARSAAILNTALLAGRTTTYVGAGGRMREIETPFHLGFGVKRATKPYGFRRAVWDAAFGYVSGFRLRDIAYFVATRSFSSRVRRWAMEREGTEFTADGIPMARVHHAGKEDQ